jgi:hypothetical protein
MTSMIGSRGFRHSTGANLGNYSTSGSSMISGAGKSGNIVPKGYQQGQIQNFTPEMMDLFQQLFSFLGPNSDLSKLAGGDQSYFDEMEAPALRQFNDVQSGIANRFSNSGMGSRNSSAFQNAQTSAASNFAQELQGKRQGLQSQALQDLMGYSNSLLNKNPYEQFLVPPKQKQQNQSQSPELMGQILSALPALLAALL